MMNNIFKILSLLTLIATTSVFIACSGASKGSTSAGNPQETALPVTLSQLSETGFLIIIIPNEAVGESLTGATVDITVNGTSTRNKDLVLTPYLDVNGDARFQIGDIQDGDEITLSLTTASARHFLFIGDASKTSSTIAINETIIDASAPATDLVKFTFTRDNLDKVEVPKNLIMDEDVVSIGYSERDTDGTTTTWIDHHVNATITRGASVDTLIPDFPVRTTETDNDEIVLVVYRTPTGGQKTLVASVGMDNFNQQGTPEMLVFNTLTIATDMYARDSGLLATAQDVPLPQHALTGLAARDEGSKLFFDGQINYTSTCTDRFLNAYDYFADFKRITDDLEDNGSTTLGQDEQPSVFLVTSAAKNNGVLFSFKQDINDSSFSVASDVVYKLESIGGFLKKIAGPVAERGSIYKGKMILTFNGKLTTTQEYTLTEEDTGPELKISTTSTLSADNVDVLFRVSGTCGFDYTLHL